MNLSSIAAEINSRAETHWIGRLQEFRGELKGGKGRVSKHIFHPQTIFEDGKYAYHYGGRTELQFNIGFEHKKHFRYGVAFSLEPSRSFPDPEEVLLPKVLRFNEFLRVQPEQFSNMLMWYWDEKQHRSSDYAPSPIQADLIRRGMFVFLGKMQSSSNIDYDKVLQDFDRLLPLYRYVEGTVTFPEVSSATKRGFRFKSGCTVKPATTIASITERQLNVSLRQNEIQMALYKHLSSLYGPNEVGTELDSAGGQVDVVVRRGGNFWFYEIKTAMSARACIREALAQLLEYSFWPGAQQAEKLIIVGEPSLDEQSEQYLAMLRKQFSLPLEYHQFNLVQGKLLA